MNTTNKPETHANAISNQSVLPFWRRLSTPLNL